VVGGLYRSLGQEACSVGAAYALERAISSLPSSATWGRSSCGAGSRGTSSRSTWRAPPAHPRPRLNVHFGWLSEEGSMPSVISMLGDMVSVLTAR